MTGPCRRSVARVTVASPTLKRAPPASTRPRTMTSPASGPRMCCTQGLGSHAVHAASRAPTSAAERTRIQRCRVATSSRPVLLVVVVVMAAIPPSCLLI